jgi:hypothetical protein
MVPINDKTFNDDFIKTCDKITIKYDNFMYIGDLNYDFLDEKKCAPLEFISQTVYI